MKTGLKIRTIELAEVRKNELEGKELENIKYASVFADSLLLDKLKDFGLKDKDNTNRILNVKCSYGYTSKEVRDLKIKLNNAKENKADKETIEDLQDKLETAIINDKYSIDKLTLRKEYYKNGFDITYWNKKKTNSKTIHYVFFFRSANKGKQGNVLFIDEKLKKQISSWMDMGINIEDTADEDGNVKMVELNAYKALVSSHIISKCKIKTNEILVVNDLDSYKKQICNVVELKDNICVNSKREYKLKNTLWDGMALIEDDVFMQNKETEKAGVMGLRQHMYKTAGFRTYIQKFYKDYCKENGLDYNTLTVKDRYGNDILVKNIRMITTENAMKWEKFFTNKSKGFKQWCSYVEDGNCMFGITKIDTVSKYDNLFKDVKTYNRMSYQMVNTLPLNTNDIVKICEDSDVYTALLRDSIKDYINYLKRTANEMNINNAIVDIYNKNNKFKDSKLFKYIRREKIKEYKKECRNGKVLVEGDNLVLCGNPYILLLHSVGALNDYIKDNEISNYEDKTLPILEEGISCYTKQFANEEDICAFRSPHNSPNNIMLFKNVISEEMDKYFNFSKNIIAVNCISTDVQDRGNGLDFDIDFILATNNKYCVKGAKIAVRDYATIVNNVPKSNKSYKNNIKELATIDYNLAVSKCTIGETSNLAQIALSNYCNTKEKKYLDCCIICSVLAQISIDSAKREFAVDVNFELNRLRRELKMEKPAFWIAINKDLDKKQKDKIKKNKYNCPMNTLQDAFKSDNNKRTKGAVKDLQFLNNIYRNKNKANRRQANSIKEYIADYVKENSKLFLNNKITKEETVENLLNNEDFLEDQISRLKINEETMFTIINRALTEETEYNKFKIDTLRIMYKYNKEMFLNMFI